MITVKIKTLDNFSNRLFCAQNTSNENKTMAFMFKNLDKNTRDEMLAEVAKDEENKNLAYSKRFSETGTIQYAGLLKAAITEGNEESLAESLKANNCFAQSETRTIKDKQIMAKTPSNTSTIFAEGEFNRFYARALSVLAIRDGKKLIVYRAKETQNPRPESEAKIGTEIDPNKLLKDLRTNIGIDTALGIPAGPNSGISVELL